MTVRALGPRQRESDPGLLEHGLIDEFRLWIFPLMLHKGKPLFEADIDRAMRLAGSRTTDSGLAVLTYEPAGGLAFGSVDDLRDP